MNQSYAAIHPYLSRDVHKKLPQIVNQTTYQRTEIAGFFHSPHPRRQNPPPARCCYRCIACQWRFLCLFLGRRRFQRLRAENKNSRQPVHQQVPRLIAQALAFRHPGIMSRAPRVTRDAFFRRQLGQNTPHHSRAVPLPHDHPAHPPAP